MSKRTKTALIIGAIAAVISAAVVVLVFWDKIVSYFPCRKKFFCTEDMEDFADLDNI